MQLILYKVSDSDNTINKTMVDGLNIAINLKSDTNVFRPEIKLQRLPNVDYFEYNYCEIVELERYYFISEIDILNNQIFSFKMECDVLETYKNQILNSVASYKRKIKTGDYVDVPVDTLAKSNVELFSSNKGLEEGETLILTTLGNSGSNQT